MGWFSGLYRKIIVGSWNSPQAAMTARGPGLDPGPEPDGTTTAWNKDRTKVLHSHSPPARTG